MYAHQCIEAAKEEEENDDGEKIKHLTPKKFSHRSKDQNEKYIA